MGKYEKALNYHQECLSKSSSTLGQSHNNDAMHALVLNNIAQTHQSIGKFEEALKYYIEAQ